MSSVTCNGKPVNALSHYKLIMLFFNNLRFHLFLPKFGCAYYKYNFTEQLVTLVLISLAIVSRSLAISFCDCFPGVTVTAWWKHIISKYN